MARRPLLPPHQASDTLVTMPLKRNYHTHTHRCKHASGDCEDYAREAMALGMEVLGFSDHTALPDGRWDNVRMHMDELLDYERAIMDAQNAFPDLMVLKAMECEYTPEYHSFYADELLDKRDYDYLIGAGHYVGIDDHWYGAWTHSTAPEHLRYYVDQLIATIDSGLFIFIAHPDVFGCCNHEWNADCEAASRDICQAAVAKGVPLELNGYGIRKPWIDTPSGRRAMYPWLPFWEVAAAEGVQVVLSSDAHRPIDVGHGSEELGAIRDHFGLQEVDVLDLLAQRMG